MAIENRNLPVGTRLWANYKKTRYVCTVEAGEDGALAFVLEDGSRHKSPSAAGSNVMGGKAVNGWRFWSVEGEAVRTKGTEAKPAEKKARGSRKKSTKVIFRTPRQDVGKGKSSWFCSPCMKSFVVDGEEEPQQCPEGHRIDDPELNAPAGVSIAEEAGVSA